MAFRHSDFGIKLARDPDAAYEEFRLLCGKHRGNLRFVADELGVGRITVGRWVDSFVQAGRADPRGEYGPGGLPVPQRRNGPKKKLKQ
jgi:hypothetical protein